jgi:ankyrin repeat protein
VFSGSQKLFTFHNQQVPEGKQFFYFNSILANQNWNSVLKMSDYNEGLVYSAHKGNVESVRDYLQKGANINHPSSLDQDTALIAATRQNHPDVVRELLTHEGIKVNFRDQHGNSALFIASRENRFEIVHELLTHQDIKVNFQNQLGETAVSIASEKNHLDTVRELLKDQDVNVNIKNHSGDTALFVANFENRFDIVGELLKHITLT